MTTEPETAAPDRTRLILRSTAVVLWILVGLGAYSIWQVRQNPPEETATAQSGIALTDDDESGDGRVIAVKAPEPQWNPDGLSDFELIERSGRTVTKQDLLGRRSLFCFVFTQCTAGPCPRISAKMQMLQSQLKETDIRLVSVTVDPENDTPAALAKYADSFGADPDRWWFLTGDKDAIYRMINLDFRMPVGELQGEIMHTNNIMLVDADGVIRKKYNALSDSEMTALVRELRGPRKESAESAAGESVAP